VSGSAASVFVFWFDARSGHNVAYMQRLDSSGTPKLAADGIEASPLGAFATPHFTGSLASSFVATDASGGAWVAWADSRSGNTDVYAQRFDSQGVPMLLPGGVATASHPSPDSRPSIVPDGAGGCIVGWQRNVIVSTVDAHSMRIAPQGGTYVTEVQNGSSPKVPDRLLQNRPNPFNPETVIPYSLAERGRVSVRIFDLSGRCIRTLVDGVQDAGVHRARWTGNLDSGENAASSVYFYRITYPDMTTSSKKMTILR